MPVARLPVSVSTSGGRWASAWRGRETGIQQTMQAAIAGGAMRGEWAGHVEVELSSDAAVRVLNRTFRGKDKPTNVLSFPNLRTPYGSIILAFETIKAEAQAQDKTLIRHAKHMILHGFLHLLGYDHETVTDRRLMERLEIRILGSMGIPNPYLLAK